jgi:hypothetical protein
MSLRRRCLVLLLCLGLACPMVSFGQSEIILGHRILLGHLNYCEDVGSSDDYACDLDPPILTYITGACYTFVANTSNTLGATLALNSLAAVPITKAGTGGVQQTLATGDILANQQVHVCYDGTTMQCQNCHGRTVRSYAVPFTTQTVVNIAGTDHALGTTDLLIQCWDTSTPHQLLPVIDATVADGSFDVVITFSTSQSGRCVLQG